MLPWNYPRSAIYANMHIIIIIIIIFINNVTIFLLFIVQVPVY